MILYVNANVRTESRTHRIALALLDKLGAYEETYSYGYISALARDFFGIKETKLIKAEMMDVDCFDAEAILKKTIDEIEL